MLYRFSFRKVILLCLVGYYASRQGCNPDEWSTSVVCACDIPIDIKLVVFVNAVLVFLRLLYVRPGHISTENLQT